MTFRTTVRKALSALVLLTFTCGQILPPAMAAQPGSVLNLPMPGAMVGVSPSYIPISIKGIKIFPENPFRFDFLLDTGNSKLDRERLNEETKILIKYFLTALTVPDQDQWVNLSPYENERIVPNQFGITEMGRDLLAQDYLLKQLTASLVYPEHELGKKFWENVYRKAYEKYGDVDIPMSTFNKVWIMPEHAVVYQHGNTAVITESRLKVLLEEDYLALVKGASTVQDLNVPGESGTGKSKDYNSFGSQIVREIVLPEIEKEINEGKNFARLRQIYRSMIMAAWFKRKLKDSIYRKMYIGKNKVAGVDVEDKDIKQKIYEQYLIAYKKGVYNYIKEDVDPRTQAVIPRKYFSGGVVAGLEVDRATRIEDVGAEQLASAAADMTGESLTASIGLDPVDGSGKVLDRHKSTEEERPNKIPHDSRVAHQEIIVSPSTYPAVVRSTPSFKEFMDQALHNPKWGYYASGKVQFGGLADFTTYPDIMAPFFGQLVAEQALKMWDGMRKAGTIAEDEFFEVVEFGAGEATLAHDFLEFVVTQSKLDPLWASFAGHVKYRIYERSAALRIRQQDRLKDYSQMAEVLEGDARNPSSAIAPDSVKGLVLSNEVPDAFGVHKVIVNSAREAEVAQVLPSLNKSLFSQMAQAPFSPTVISAIELGSEKLHQDLALTDDAIYLTRETFPMFMDALSDLGKEDYVKYVAELDFNEIYVPVSFVPEVAAHLKANDSEYRGILPTVRHDTAHYINPDGEKFIGGVGGILKAGYVITIDYGDSLEGLLKKEAGGESQAFRVYPRAETERSNPYANVTLRDLTSDQDFTSLAKAGRRSGLEVLHFGPQKDLTRGTTLEWGVTLMSLDYNQLRNFKLWDKAKMINSIHEFFYGSKFKMLVQQKLGTDPQYRVFADADQIPLSIRDEQTLIGTSKDLGVSQQSDGSQEQGDRSKELNISAERKKELDDKADYFMSSFLDSKTSLASKRRDFYEEGLVRDLRRISDAEEIRYLARKINTQWRSAGLDKQLGPFYSVLAVNYGEEVGPTPADVRQNYDWIYKFLEAADPVERAQALWVLVVSNNAHLRRLGLHPETNGTEFLDQEILLGRDGTEKALLHRFVDSIEALSPEQLAEKIKGPEGSNFTLEDLLLWGLLLALDPTTYAYSMEFKEAQLNEYLRKYFGEQTDLKTAARRFLMRGLQGKQFRDRLDALLVKAVSVSDEQWAAKGLRSPYFFDLSYVYLGAMLKTQDGSQAIAATSVDDPFVGYALDLKYFSPEIVKRYLSTYYQDNPEMNRIFKQFPDGRRNIYVQAFSSPEMAGILPNSSAFLRNNGLRSSGGGALKALSVFDANKPEPEPTAAVKSAWKARSVSLAATSQIIKGFEIKAKIIEALTGELPPGALSYYVLDGNESIIAIAPGIQDENIKQELIFHEGKEAYWFKRLGNARDSHILAWAEQILAFAQEGLTPLQQMMLPVLTAQEREALLAETDRGYQEDLVKKYNGERFEEYQKNKQRFQNALNEVLPVTIPGAIPNIGDKLTEEAIQTLAQSHNVFERMLDTAVARGLARALIPIIGFVLPQNEFVWKMSEQLRKIVIGPGSVQYQQKLESLIGRWSDLGDRVRSIISQFSIDEIEELAQTQKNAQDSLDLISRGLYMLTIDFNINKIREYWSEIIALARNRGLDGLVAISHYKKFISNRNDFKQIAGIITKVGDHGFSSGLHPWLLENVIKTPLELEAISSDLISISSKTEDFYFSFTNFVSSFQFLRDRAFWNAFVALMIKTNGDEYRKFVMDSLRTVSGMLRTPEDLNVGYDLVRESFGLSGPATKKTTTVDEFYNGLTDFEQIRAFNNELRQWNDKQRYIILLASSIEVHRRTAGMGGRSEMHPQVAALGREIVASGIPNYVNIFRRIIFSKRMEEPENDAFFSFIVDPSVKLSVRMSVVDDYVELMSHDDVPTDEKTTDERAIRYRSAILETRDKFNSMMTELSVPGLSKSRQRKLAEKSTSLLSNLRRVSLEYLLGRGLSDREAQVLNDPDIREKLFTILSVAITLGAADFKEKELMLDNVRKAMGVFISSYDSSAGEKAYDLAKAKLDDFVQNLYSSDGGISKKAKSNKTIRENLIAKGYSPELWSQGVEIEVTTAKGITEQGKREGIRLATHQLVEIAIRLGVRQVNGQEVSLERAGEIDSYASAAAFIEGLKTSGGRISKEMLDYFDDVLFAIQTQEDQKVMLAPEKAKFRVTIKKDFLYEATAGLGVPGCFAPGGIHREMPLLHALESNAGFVQVYTENGKQVANAVIIYTDKGAYVDLIYNASFYDMDEVLGKALVQLTQFVPQLVLGPTSAGYKYLSRYAKPSPDRVTLVKPSVLFTKQYFDTGKVGANGDLTFEILNPLIVTSADIVAKDGSLEKSLQENVPQVTVSSPKTAAIDLQGLADVFIAKGERYKSYLFLVGALKKRIAQEGKDAVDNDFYDWVAMLIKNDPRTQNVSDEDADEIADIMIDFLEQQNWPIRIDSPPREIERQIDERQLPVEVVQPDANTATTGQPTQDRNGLPGGALKAIGVYDGGGVLKVSASSEVVWKARAGRVQVQTTAVAGETIVAKIIESQSAEMPDGMEAYWLKEDDGTLVIILSGAINRGPPELRDEAIYHEAREAHWFDQLRNERFAGSQAVSEGNLESLKRDAHILAAAEESIAFSENGRGLSPYHARQIEALSPSQRAGILNEGRQQHHQLVLEHLGSDALDAYVRYEETLRRALKSADKGRSVALDLPAERFGANVDLGRVLEEAAVDVLGYVPLFSIFGSYTYLRSPEGSVDWDRIGDLDIRIHARTSLSSEQAMDLKIKLFERLGQVNGLVVNANGIDNPRGRVNFPLAWGIQDLRLGRSLVINIQPGNLDDAFEGNGSFMSYRVTDQFFGDLSAIAPLIERSSANDMVQTTVKFYLETVAELKAPSQAPFTSKSEVGKLKTFYQLAVMRGKAEEYRWLIDESDRFSDQLKRNAFDAVDFGRVTARALKGLDVAPDVLIGDVLQVFAAGPLAGLIRSPLNVRAEVSVFDGVDTASLKSEESRRDRFQSVRKATAAKITEAFQRTGESANTLGYEVERLTDAAVKSIFDELKDLEQDPAGFDAFVRNAKVTLTYRLDPRWRTFALTLTDSGGGITRDIFDRLRGHYETSSQGGLKGENAFEIFQSMLGATMAYNLWDEIEVVSKTRNSNYAYRYTTGTGGQDSLNDYFWSQDSGTRITVKGRSARPSEQKAATTVPALDSTIQSPQNAMDRIRAMNGTTLTSKTRGNFKLVLEDIAPKTDGSSRFTFRIVKPGETAPVPGDIFLKGTLTADGVYVRDLYRRLIDGSQDLSNEGLGTEFLRDLVDAGFKVEGEISNEPTVQAIALALESGRIKTLADLKDVFAQTVLGKSAAAAGGVITEFVFYSDDYFSDGAITRGEEAFRKFIEHFAERADYFPLGYIVEKATAQPNPPGGIDMNPNALDLQTRGDGVQFDMPFDPARWESIPFEGFSPVILRIDTTNLPVFLGAQEVNSESTINRV